MIKQNQDTSKFDAKLEDVVERSGKFGPYLLWSFKDTSGNRCVGFTEANLKFGNRLWVWLYCLGFYIQPGDSFDLTSLKGQNCLIILGGKDNTVSAVVPIGNTAGVKNWTTPPPTEPGRNVELEQKKTPTPVQQPTPEDEQKATAKVQDEVDRLFN